MFCPYKKEGGRGRKVLAMLKGRYRKFRDSFYAVA